MKIDTLEIKTSDVWFAQTQPYGYWRVGNPLIKLIPVLLMLIGSSISNPSLVLQGVLISEFILYAPFNSKSHPLIIIFYTLISTITVAIFSSKLDIIPYINLRSLMTFEIPRFTTIDGFFSLTIIIMMIALIRYRRVFTTRDYTWLIDFIPGKKLRKFLGESFYAHAYGWLQLPNVITEIDMTLRSRGISRPNFFNFIKCPNVAIDNLGLWTLSIIRRIEEMAVLVEFFLTNRIRFETRHTPIGRHFSYSDVVFFTMFIIGVLISRIVV